MHAFPVVQETGGQLLETGIRTLQKTLLLKKQVEVEQVDNDLHDKRKEFREKMEQCAEKQIEIQKRQQSVRFTCKIYLVLISVPAGSKKFVAENAKLTNIFCSEHIQNSLIPNYELCHAFNAWFQYLFLTMNCVMHLMHGSSILVLRFQLCGEGEGEGFN